MGGKMSIHLKGILTVAVIIIGAVCIPVDAATVAYYRFEDSPGFTNDSEGTRHLVNNGAVQTNLPVSGRGSKFPDPIPLTSAANTNAAEMDGGDYFDTGAGGGNLITTDKFTVEALVHMDTIAGQQAIAAQWDTGGKRSWILRLESGAPHLLVSSNGTGFEKQSSGLTMVEDRDYRLAVTYDEGAASFYLRDFTFNRDTSNSATFSTHTSVFATDQLTVGAQFGGAVKLDGLLDEVRISDAVLDITDFLVPTSSAPNEIVGDTAVYYRFEDSPGFTNDSSGNGFEGEPFFDLDNTSVVQTNIPASGRGSAFPYPVPQTSAANSDAAYMDATSDRFDTGNSFVDVIETNFTAEAFINPSAVGSRGVIVGMWDDGADERSFMFSVESSDLTLFLSESGGDNQSDSAGFTIAADKDYFVAVSYDQVDQVNGIVFYATNLTDGGALQVSTASHSIVTLHQDDRLTVGAVASGANGYVGFLDEVRLSTRVLAYSEMLISDADAGPPTAAGMVVTLE